MVIIGLLKRLFKKSDLPSVQRHATSLNNRVQLDEALNLVLPLVFAQDVQARLVFIASGLDLQMDGRSTGWEFHFVLPEKKSLVWLSLEPDQSWSGQSDVMPLNLKQYTQSIQSDSDLHRPALQLIEYRNSPEVVQSLAEKGADFISGPSDMKIESRFITADQPVWVTYCYDQEYLTEFK